MKRSLFAVFVLVLAAVGAAYATGVGPAPGGTGTNIEAFPTETPAPAAAGGGSESTTTATASATATATTTGPPFTFAVEQIEQCGQTCRDVTSTLTNEQATAATDVTVYTRVYVGNDTSGDVVWEGTESVGTLESGEPYTATRRVALSLTEAYAVRSADGWITIRTTIQTAERTVTFTEQRDVA